MVDWTISRCRPTYLQWSHGELRLAQSSHPPFVFFFLEKGPLAIVSAAIPIAATLTWVYPVSDTPAPFPVLTFLSWVVAIPLLVLVAFSIGMLITSWRTVEGGTTQADWSAYLKFKDESMNEKYKNCKIPIDVVYEHYINSELEFLQDFYVS